MRGSISPEELLTASDSGWCSLVGSVSCKPNSWLQWTSLRHHTIEVFDIILQLISRVVVDHLHLHTCIYDSVTRLLHTQPHLFSHLVFEWCSISSASRQSPCSRGPRVRMSITMATQPNNLSGDRNSMPTIVMAASATAHTLGKAPRGRGMRASWSWSDCICQGTVRLFHKTTRIDLWVRNMAVFPVDLMLVIQGSPLTWTKL